MKLSVILCTHNPHRGRLDRTLEGLKKQTLPRAEWEFILVDNASAPPLQGAVDLSWHPLGQIIVEPETGLTRARLRGMSVAKGDIFLFVDDDMVAEPDYLASASDIYDKHPFIGMLGGFGTAEYEVPLPIWLEDFRGFYLDHAGNDDRRMGFQYAMTRQYGPWIPVGAGMSIRSNIAAVYRARVEKDDFSKDLGRKGNSLSGSEDTDMAYTTVELGYACACSDRLKFLHIVPRHRLEFDYMVRLLYTSQYCAARLLIHRGWKKQVPLNPRTPLFYARHVWEEYRPRNKRQKLWHACMKGYYDAIAGVPMNRRYVG